jgi:Phage tail lysozyme
MSLLDIGWTEEQANGLLDGLRLRAGIPDWKPEHLQKLHDWCSAHGKDHKTIEGQIDFVAYELVNCYEKIGNALRQAKTVEEARMAAEPYIARLRGEPGNEG